MRQFISKGGHEYMLECAQKYGPIFKIWMGTSPWVVIADAEASRRLFVRLNDRFNGNQGLARNKENKIIVSAGLVGANGLLWRKIRNAWQPFFQPDNLSALTGLMNRCAMALVERLEQTVNQEQAVDISKELGDMTMAVVGTTAFGVDFHTLDTTISEDSLKGRRLVENAKRMFTSSSLKNFSIYGFINFLIPAWNPVLAFLANRFPDASLRKSRAAFDGLKDTSFEIIRGQLKGTTTPAAANGNGTADAGSHAVPEKQQHIPDAGLEGADEANYVGGFVPLLARKLSELEIVAQTNTFISAGYETTANTLSMAVYNISRSPEVERTLLAEIDAFGRDKELTYEELQKFPYTEAVLKETLRLHGPVPFMNRVTRDDIQVNGYTIPRGANVVISFWNLHHDPQHWPQPWEFQPQRFMPGGQAETVHPGAYVPFGAGARACIGIKFAMMEAKLALIRLYQHYVFRLEGGADAYPPVKFFQALTLSPIGGVRVNVLKRS